MKFFLGKAIRSLKLREAKRRGLSATQVNVAGASDYILDYFLYFLSSRPTLES